MLELVGDSSGKRRESVYRVVESGPDRKWLNLQNVAPLAIARLYGDNYEHSASEGRPPGPRGQLRLFPTWTEV